MESIILKVKTLHEYLTNIELSSLRAAKNNGSVVLGINQGSGQKSNENYNAFEKKITQSELKMKLIESKRNE